MSAQPKFKYTLAEYLALDCRSEARLEYWDGEVFDMSGVSKAHARIERDVMTRLAGLTASGGCEVFPANMRLKVPSLPPYRYGDLSGLCGEAQFVELGGVDVLTNPSLIVEVLSDSTEAYDRGDKFTHYKSIPSFREYLLIARHRPHVSHFVRQADDAWVQREYNELTDVVALVSLGCELPLREIYEHVVFAIPAPNPQFPPLG